MCFALVGLAQIYAFRSWAKESTYKYGCAAVANIKLSIKAAECFEEMTGLRPRDAPERRMGIYHAVN